MMSTLTTVTRTERDAGVDLLVAGRAHLPRRTLAVVEAPDTALVRGQRPGQDDAHPMLARGKIDLALAVPVAELEQPPAAVDAQPLDRVARPAAAVALAGEAALRLQNAVAARRRDVTLEVGFAAEQAKPVLDLPFDARHCAARLARASGGHQLESSSAIRTRLEKLRMAVEGSAGATPRPIAWPLGRKCEAARAAPAIGSRPRARSAGRANNGDPTAPCRCAHARVFVAPGVLPPPVVPRRARVPVGTVPTGATASQGSDINSTPCRLVGTIRRETFRK